MNQPPHYRNPSDTPIPSTPARRPEPQHKNAAGSHEPKTALYLAAPMTRPTHSRGVHRRLARQLREAALRATPHELHELDRLERAVRGEAITVLDAHRILRDVIREQHNRQLAEAA